MTVSPTTTCVYNDNNTPPPHIHAEIDYEQIDERPSTKSLRNQIRQTMHTLLDTNS